MRRLLLAAAFAVVFHGWLLSSRTAWLLPGPPATSPQRAVTISLTAFPAPEPTPAERTAPPEPLPAEKVEAPPPVAPEPKAEPKADPPQVSEPAPEPRKNIDEPAPAPPAAEEKPAPDKAPALPQYSSVFDSVDTPSRAPLIPEGIAALSSKAERAPEAAGAATDPEMPPGRETAAVTEARPLYRENPPPDYPRIARHRGYQGTVILEVLVDATGRVRQVKTAETSGHAVLDRAAEAAVATWRFEPGRRGDDPMQMWVKVPVRFELK